jgi:hypothetical protein
MEVAEVTIVVLVLPLDFAPCSTSVHLPALLHVHFRLYTEL